MHDFTPIHAVVGGALIALSLAIFLLATGRMVGLSGIVAGLLRESDRTWRTWFVLGMLTVGAVFAVVLPATFDTGSRTPTWLTACSGVLVGVGTRLGNGCTSGHGLCGVSRLSRRSIAATATFFGCAVVTATLLGGRLP